MACKRSWVRIPLAPFNSWGTSVEIREWHFSGLHSLTVYGACPAEFLPGSRCKLTDDCSRCRKQRSARCAEITLPGKIEVGLIDLKGLAARPADITTTFEEIPRCTTAQRAVLGMVAQDQGINYFR